MDDERRAELIRKKNREGLSVAEQEEFADLQRRSREATRAEFLAGLSHIAEQLDLRENVAERERAVRWLVRPPHCPGWWLYRDARGLWLCFCEDDGSELTWRTDIPPGAWDGEWCGPLEVPT
ncbi:MAG: hypothetical protein E6Q76_09655 [Rhizobium sp.]|nr:MAG: hypothetical protein E6Q76_09655 [Rhizobium sp.]